MIAGRFTGVVETADCPACGAKGCPMGRHSVSIRLSLEGDPITVGPCAACGWVLEPAVERRHWSAPEHLPKSAGMGAEEFAFRAGLFHTWKTRPASELSSQFLVFADWLADRNDAEEAAARADWVPYMTADPKGCRDWTVPVAHGMHSWLTLPGRPPVPLGVWFPAGGLHNARWLLCWPPGFVRFTGPHPHGDLTRWRVTTFARSLLASSPIDYAAIFHPRHTGLVRAGDRVRVAEPDLGLFNDSEGTA
jgi:hypothetical protein